MSDTGTYVDITDIKSNADIDWQIMLYTGQKLMRDVQDAEAKPSLIIVHLLSLREINEMYSRSVTDAMLEDIRDFCAETVPGATLYRLGGAKFCLAVKEARGEAAPVDVELKAEELRRRFDEAWDVGGIRVYCGAELVILSAEYVRYNTDPLMNVIDRAVFFTRKRNRGVLYYNSTVNHSNIRSQRFDYSLKNCVYGGMQGFNVYYQPVADPMTGVWCGLEALCRWVDPESGNVPADVFISAAERLKLIDEIGLWVLETAVTKCKEWALDKIEAFTLEVNISPMQFTDPTLVERIINILDKNNFPSLKLCFEITDGTQVVFNADTVELMEKLRARNITFALDDFGAGYSAFNRLNRLPVDVVKVEYNFTSNIVDDSHLRHLFRAISELAHTANLQVVAEGVESAAQMQVLLENGADLLQGYLISKPIPPGEMEKQLFHFKEPDESYRFLSRKIDVSVVHEANDEFFFTSSLNRISNRCVHTLLYENDINVAVEKALAIVGKHIDVSRAYVFRRGSGNLFDNTHEWCAEGVESVKHRLVDMPVTENMWQYMNTQGSIYASNLGELPQDIYELLAWQQINAILLIPLWEENEIFGFVGFDDCFNHRKWRPEEVLFLHSFSLIVASVMNRVRETDELARLNRRSARRTGLVHGINHMLERLSLPDKTSFDEAMASGLEKFARALDTDRIAVMRCAHGIDAPRSQMVLSWDRKTPGKVDRELNYMPESAALRDWSAILRQDICINQNISEADDDQLDVMLAQNAKAMLMVPAFIHGVYWGSVIYMDTQAERPYEADITDLMRSATRIIINGVIRTEIEDQLLNESSYNKELIGTLSKREKMLGALNQTAVSFLAQSQKTFRDQLYVGMDIMSAYANICHILIWKREEVYGFPRYTLYRKWSDRKGLAHSSIDEGGILPFGPFADWDIICKHNGYINCRLWELPEPKQKIMTQYGINALLVFPVFAQDRLWGLVSFDNGDGVLYSKDEVDILRNASLMLGSVIIRDEEAAKAREAEARVKLMLDATPLCCQLWDKDGHVIDCNEAAYKLFGLTCKEELIEKTQLFTPEYQPDGKNSYEASVDYLRKAFMDGVVIYDWMFQLPDGKPLPTEVTLKRVAYKDGYIVAGYTRDLRRLKLLEEEAGKAYFDPLTGIYNRRFLDENLPRVIKTLSRSGGTLSLMIVDIDMFKKYNDTYGHLKGDECLRLVAETLSAGVTRSDDFVARYGGEEFAVVLPNTDADGATVIANRLLESVRAKECRHVASDVCGYVTISVGIITGKVNNYHTEQDFISGADIMLYEAKHSGRNKYCRGAL